MILPFAAHLLFQDKEDQQHIENLSMAFFNNDRMKLLIRNSSTDFLKSVKIIITYCYYMVKKWGGIFISSERSSYLLYYQKSKHYFSFYDIFRYLYLAIYVVGISRIASVYQREKMITSIRAQQIKQSQDQDFLYVWFLAQKKSNKQLKGLMEAKAYILNKSQYLNLPIYMETTEERLVKIYERIGFQFYHIESYPQMKIWFGKYQG